MALFPYGFFSLSRRPDLWSARVLIIYPTWAADLSASSSLAAAVVFACPINAVGLSV